MAKKSKSKKPAAKPPGKSWRTLMRRATDKEKAGHPNVATTLRTEAAKLRRPDRKRSAPKKSRPSKTRRSEVAAKGWETRRQRQIDKVPVPDYFKLQQAMTVGGVTTAIGADETANANRAPVHKAVEQELVEKVGKLSRKRGGTELVLREIVDYGLRQKQIGYSDASTSSGDMLEHARQVHHEQMVSGWLVEFAALKGMHPGNAVPPGVVFQLNSHVAAAIAEALQRAGWTTHGRVNGAQRQERREALMGKLHTDVARFA